MSSLLSRAPVVGALLLLGACATYGDRSDRGVGTTTVTGAVVDPEPVATAPQPASWRLASEICKRRASCEEDGAGGSSVGATAEGACIEQERPAAETMLSSWNCSPAAERARLEQCLAAMHTAPCEPLTSGVSTLPTCRANVTCGSHVAR